MEITVIDALFGGGITGILITLVLTAMSITSFGIIIAEGHILRRDLAGLPHAYAESADLPHITERLINTVWEKLRTEIDELPEEAPEVHKIKVREIIYRQEMKGRERLSLLASIGANAPFIGLFGTVVGIMSALSEIGKGGVISATDVAPPVGEALVMTAFGLLVAVPAVIGYNTLMSGARRRNDHMSTLALRFDQPKEDRISLDTVGQKMAQKANEELERSVENMGANSHGNLSAPVG